jgi:acyl-coenzyme A thioesterase PaaI-like protein
MSQQILSAYRTLSGKPGGKWLFSKLVCWKAPYFSSIAPRIETLEPGRCVATIKHRRAVTNHIGTVHAIALCNLAEFTGGLACDVSIPASMRWIPKGMTVS